MNNFIRKIDGFYNNNIYLSDTDSLFVENKYWDLLDKTELVREETCQNKNDYKTGGIFYVLFLAPKIKFCLTIDNYGYVQEQKTFEKINNNERLLDRSHYFEMTGVKKICVAA